MSVKTNHLFSIVLCTLILLAGCTSTNGSLVDETLKEDFVPTMTLQLIKNGVESSIERKAHKWEVRLSSEESRTSFIDYAPSVIPLNVNQKVNVMFENNPVLSVYLVGENEAGEEIPLVKNWFIAPGKKGHYFYQVVAEWPNGKATYSLNVQVQ